MSDPYFYGYGYYAPQPLPAFKGHNCDVCGVLIEKREQCVDLSPGLMEESQKSGNPIVVSDGIDPDLAEFPRGIVHIWCAEEFCATNYTPPMTGLCQSCGVSIEDPESELCARCEEAMTGEG